jgi:hypothetical protein
MTFTSAPTSASALASYTPPSAQELHAREYRTLKMFTGMMGMAFALTVTRGRFAGSLGTILSILEVVAWLVLVCGVFWSQTEAQAMQHQPASTFALEELAKHKERPLVRNLLERIASMGRPISQYEANLMLRYALAEENLERRRKLEGLLLQPASPQKA